MPVAFVSYARADLGFVQTLTDALSRSDHKVAWDQDEDRATVRPAARWWAEITAAIQASDKFVFVISPASVASQTCRRELSYAVSLHKQVIPVMRREPAPGQEMPPELEGIDWISFEPHAALSAQLPWLIRALDTDLEISARHARLLVRTAEWNSSKRRRRSQLLRGQELKAYEAILDQAVSDQPDSPTQEQRVYVAASRRWRRELRTFFAAGLVLLAGVGYFTAVQLGQRGNQALAGTLATAADQAAATDPSVAALLEVAANQADATPDSKTRLLSTGTEALSSKLTGPRQAGQFGGGQPEREGPGGRRR